jgi:hypothetical protein
LRATILVRSHELQYEFLDKIKEHTIFASRTISRLRFMKSDNIPCYIGNASIEARDGYYRKKEVSSEYRGPRKFNKRKPKVRNEEKNAKSPAGYTLG